MVLLTVFEDPYPHGAGSCSGSRGGQRVCASRSSRHSQRGKRSRGDGDDDKAIFLESIRVSEGRALADSCGDRLEDTCGSVRSPGAAKKSVHVGWLMSP